MSEEVWRERILNCQNSGLPVSEWCRKNHIAPVSYYRHLRKLAVRYAEEYLKKNNYSTVKPHITGDNIDAQMFFQKIGYAIEDSKNIMFDDGDNVEQLTFLKKLL